MNIRSFASAILYALRIKIEKLTEQEFGVSMKYDVEKVLRRLRDVYNEVIVFDIGANTGQTVHYLNGFGLPITIHAFEPSTSTFELLTEETKNIQRLILNNVGLGAKSESQLFYHNAQSDISSFLKPTDQLWGKVVKEELIQITTLDAYVRKTQIDRIHYLKIDTQGFDLEVLKGAENLLTNKKIDVIQMEITMETFYESQPKMYEILRFLDDFNFQLIAFYKFHNDNFKARWTDALFVSSSFMENVKSLNP